MDGGTYSDTLGVRDDESFVVGDENVVWPYSTAHVTIFVRLAVFIIFGILER